MVLSWLHWEADRFLPNVSPASRGDLKGEYCHVQSTLSVTVCRRELYSVPELVPVVVDRVHNLARSHEYLALIFCKFLFSTVKWGRPLKKHAWYSGISGGATWLCDSEPYIQPHRHIAYMTLLWLGRAMYTDWGENTSYDHDTRTHAFYNQRYLIGLLRTFCNSSLHT